MVRHAPTVLVTGGAGPLGVAIIHRLLRAGFRVVGEAPAIPGPVDSLDTHPSQLCVRVDVLDTVSVEGLLGACELVIHLAAVTDTNAPPATPCDALDVAILGTRTVLATCLRHGRPVLVAVQGIPPGNDPAVAPPRDPQWLHAASEAAVAYALAYANAGLACVVVRYPPAPAGDSMDAAVEATMRALRTLPGGELTVGEAGTTERDTSSVDREPTPAMVPWMLPRIDPDAALMDRIHRSLASGVVTNHGPAERALEGALARHLGMDPATVVAVASGAAGLLLAARAMDLPPGRAVLPAFTFIATLAAVVHAGHAPLYCDIDPDTWTLSPGHLADLLARHPDVRLVCPVNVFGVPPALEAITDLARRAGARVLFDNAHGFGTEVSGLRAPRGLDGQVYSLHATKTLPAVEGGLVVAGDPALADEVRRLRRHGLDPSHVGTAPGFNARMSELHAAVGLHSLSRFETASRVRRGAFHRLRRALTARGFGVQTVPPGVESSAQNLGVRMPAGAPMAAWVAAWGREGVEVRRYFHPLLHTLPRCGGEGVALPVTESVAARLLCLPMHARLDEHSLRRIERAADRLAVCDQGALCTA